MTNQVITPAPAGIDKPSHVSPDAQQRTAFQWRPWLLAFGLWLALAAVASIALWHLRRDLVESQRRELGLLSLALTDEIDRGLRGAEVGLHALAAELREGRLAVQDGQAARALRTRADLMPQVRTLWLVDRSERLLLASDLTPPPELASFLPALDALADDAIAVGRPFPDTQQNETLIALAIRFSGAAGSPGGWILAGMPSGTLLGAFSAALPAADARMSVFRNDGVRLAGANFTTPTLDEASQAVRLANRPNLEVRRFRDGREHLVGLHEIARYGVKVVVSRDLGAVLTAWRRTAELAAAAFALLMVILAGAVHLVQRANRRRSAAQHALRAQRSRASKLESLGTLAGGVAHDFNNVLAGIVGYGEMAQDAAAAGSDQARHLDRMLRAASRGKALVERILAFSRGGAHASVVFELEPVVEEVLTLLSGSLRPGVILERGLEAHGARLRGDPTQAFEALMNLCTNALQAMPAGGTLSVSLERTHVAATRVLSHSELSPGDYLALSVADQGGGITADVMEHLFEPFFTTRSKESGTGLGLAVVHGVVAETGGAIDVRSTAGQGACFTLYFPESTDPLDISARPAASVPGGSGQRLLVVDDEPELVSLAEETLKGLGYAPVGYGNPVAALEALRADPQGFAAVITDEVMPHLCGTQLTEALRQHAPHLPVLLVTGYGGALLAERAARAGVTRVLAKPLGRAELARALADLLH